MPAITEPGIYDMPAETYHGLCTPTPALSAGFIWTLDRESPARAWYDSALNPAYERSEKDAFDIGTAAHLLFLEPDTFADRVVRIEHDTYQSKAARDVRDAAREAGKTPLKPRDYAAVLEMKAALHNKLQGLPFDTAPIFAQNGITGGRAEQSYFWRDTVTGIWCRSRPDYVRPFSTDTDVLVDYKSMAEVEDLNRYAISMGWHARAAWYIDGHQALTGRPAEYWYIAQQKRAPYFVTVAKIDDRALDWGRKINARARHVFADCLETGRWPTNRDGTVVITLPVWAEMQLNDRLDAGDFKPRADKPRKTGAQKLADARKSREIAPYFAP